MESELQEVLAYCQERCIVLIPGPRSIRLWGPGRRIPASIQQAVRRYRREIRTMIGRADVLTCPNPDLHQRWHDVIAGRPICAACSRLARGMRRAKAAEPYQTVTQVA